MIDILTQIVEHKKLEVSAKKSQKSVEELMDSKYFHRQKLSLKYAVKKSPNGIIAEFKRKSPSKQNINIKAEIDEILPIYKNFNVAGISILTDETFFGGTLQDLRQAKKYSIPLLRKDFIIDPYQIYEAKSYGADAILLIAAILDNYEIKEFTAIAHDVGLEVLLEFHAGEDFLKRPKEIDLVGINNRNLKSFEVDFEHAIKMRSELPADAICVAESGISSAENFLRLKKNNFQGFLIGEFFMKSENLANTFQEFINQIDED